MRGDGGCYACAVLKHQLAAQVASIHDEREAHSEKCPISNRKSEPAMDRIDRGKPQRHARHDGEKKKPAGGVMRRDGLVRNRKGRVSMLGRPVSGKKGAAHEHSAERHAEADARIDPIAPIKWADCFEQRGYYQQRGREG